MIIDACKPTYRYRQNIAIVLIFLSHTGIALQCSHENVLRNAMDVYTRLVPNSMDFSLEYYLDILNNACAFGIEHDLDHCFAHCSLNENCVAVYVYENRCWFCSSLINNIHALNSEINIHDVYIHLERLGSYNL